MTIEITDEMRKVAGDAVHDHLYDKLADRANSGKLKGNGDNR